MNKVIMMGRLTRDPEVTYTSGEKSTAIAKFGLAVDRRNKREGQPDADFFDAVTFGKRAEFVEKYLHKGTKIVITGEMQNNNYTNKEGQKVYRDQIMIEDIEFAESKASGTSSSTAAPEAPAADVTDIPVTEELPFS